MSIKSDATKDEKSSPFYKNNKKFCKNVEGFVLDKGGNVHGYYNAWSYHIIAEVFTPQKWRLAYKKSTFSSNHILLNSKSQNIRNTITWETMTRFKKNEYFIIKKRNILNNLSFNIKKQPEFNLPSKYYFKGNIKDFKIVDNIIHILDKAFINYEIETVHLKNKILIIKITSKNTLLNLFKKLLYLNI
ncbi:hypothetical protein [Flavobacterium sp. CS20]|jgi:hypothetical protein|uniref:hypothetical protein n=1 Tax=Flavobacterium sp. CS20 TaxID=2775246 RepID=UPI001B3A0C67|nr:hypothetical protein [Flavobacterium sp. CS20]QTY28217.1 hypothetical protein IGB25_07015 [Flavobacterium sp. CS20]